MIGVMSEYWSLEAPQSSDISRRARLMLAIASVLVLLMCVGVVEVGALAAVSVVSSGRNHR